MELNLRSTRALLFALGLLLFGACGDDPTELAAGQPSDTDPPAQETEEQADPEDQVDPEGDALADDDTSSSDAVDLGASQPAGDIVRVESRLDLVSTQPAVIDELVIDVDGTTVLVRYTNAAEPCSGAHVAVTETDTTVEVSLETGLDPNAAAMSCIAQIFHYEIAVPLATPLGSRELVVVPAAPGEQPAVDPFEGAEFPTDQYLGLTEVEAMKLGDVEQRIVRVARRDDEIFGLTMDFSPTRVNIEIEGGVVILATSG